MTRTELNEAVQRFKQAVTNAINAITDDIALTAIPLFPSYESLCRDQKTVPQGFRFRYGDKLYKTLQPSTTFDGTFSPSIHTASLYAEITLPDDGTFARPIAYNGNMELEQGKYYLQGAVRYVCTRSTGVPVYNNLSDLVGIYVEIA